MLVIDSSNETRYLYRYALYIQINIHKKYLLVDDYCQVKSVFFKKKRYLFSQMKRHISSARDKRSPFLLISVPEDFWDSYELGLGIRIYIL